MCLGIPAAPRCDLHRNPDFTPEQLDAMRVLAALMEQRDGLQDGHVKPRDVIDVWEADKFAATCFTDDELWDALRVLVRVLRGTWLL